MEAAIDDGAGRDFGVAVVERPAVGEHAVPLCVAQRLPLLEQIQAAGAGAALDPHLPVVKQAQQHLSDLEDLHALVLVDVIELCRGVQLARNDRVVEVGRDVRVRELLELHRSRRAEAHQVQKAVTSVARGLGQQVGEALFELLLEGLALLWRHARQLFAQKRFPQALNGLGRLDTHGE
jgi:hypothetical protein